MKQRRLHRYGSRFATKVEETQDSASPVLSGLPRVEHKIRIIDLKKGTLFAVERTGRGSALSGKVNSAASRGVISSHPSRLN